MADLYLYDDYIEQVPVAYNPEQENVFTNLAVQILGESVIERRVVISGDEEFPEDANDIVTEVAYYIKPQCSNMVASISWSLFLTTSLLVFGLIRSLFNAFCRGAD